MRCFVYKSLKKADTYVYLARRDDAAALPAALRATLGELDFVLEIELTAERKLAREDAGVAEALGKNVLWVRARSFALGGAILGIAGSLHAFYYTYIDPTQFSTILTA